MKRMEHLTEDQKLRIVDLMTATLVKEGRERIDDQELVEFVMSAIDPLVESAERHRSPPRMRTPLPPPSQSRTGAPEFQFEYAEEYQSETRAPSSQVSPMHWRRNQMYASELQTEVQPWTGDFETGTTRSVGIAIPPLPQSYAR